MTRIRAVSVFFALCVVLGAAVAENASKAVKFDFRAVSVAQVIQLIYADVLGMPYVLAPEVLSDARVVSFKYTGDKNDVRLFASTFLASLGYEAQHHEGVDVIAKRQEEAKPAPVVELESFVYRPRYRDVNYIARLLAPLFKGSFSSNRTVAGNGARSTEQVPDGSAAAMVDQIADVLVFTGQENEVERLKELLPQVDFQLGEVVVRGVVYEVSLADKQGSAFGLFASLLSGKFSAGVGAADSLGAFLRFKNTAIEAVYSVLSQDSRFKVMSSPSLRIRSGAEGTFSVGQDVPVLGSVSYPANGQSVQSVEYRSSGVLFNVVPTVREGVIDLDIDQQLSNFAQTTTGVNNSPTLTKRALRTSVGMQDGDLIVLGGLTENKESDTRDGPSFLPRFFHTTGRDNSRSEILLVLQVQRI